MKHQFALTVLFASYLASGHAEEQTRRRKLVEQETWMAGDSLKEDEPYWSRLLEVMSMSVMPDKGDGDDDDDDGDSIPVASPVGPGKPGEGDDQDDNTFSPSSPTASPNGDTSSPTASPNGDTSSPTASGDIAPAMATISNDSPISPP